MHYESWANSILDIIASLAAGITLPVNAHTLLHCDLWRRKREHILFWLNKIKVRKRQPRQRDVSLLIPERAIVLNSSLWFVHFFFYLPFPQIIYTMEDDPDMALLQQGRLKGGSHSHGTIPLTANVNIGERDQSRGDGGINPLQLRNKRLPHRRSNSDPFTLSPSDERALLEGEKWEISRISRLTLFRSRCNPYRSSFWFWTSRNDVWWFTELRTWTQRRNGCVCTNSYCFLLVSCLLISIRWNLQSCCHYSLNCISQAWSHIIVVTLTQAQKIETIKRNRSRDDTDVSLSVHDRMKDWRWSYSYCSGWVSPLYP